MKDEKIVYKKIKVSSNSPVPQLTGSIMKSIEAGENVELRAIGASSVSQMFKAVASARGYLAMKGKDLYLKPGFDEIGKGRETRTVMVARLVVD